MALEPRIVSLRSAVRACPIALSAVIVSHVFFDFARGADLGAEPVGSFSAPPTVAASLAPVIRHVLPAVVTVFATRTPTAPKSRDREVEKPVYVPDFGESEVRHNCQARSGGHKVPETISRDLSRSMGSGVIVDPSGYVVSSAQLVADARELTVRAYDGSQHTAQLVGSDGLTDLALLKIDTNGPAPYLNWGDSDTALIGDWVLAAGSPFGLTNSVRLGILSARGRDLNLGPYDDFLQIDAAINLGDSGGPEVNLTGQVIGINTAIYASDAGSIGIAFATPSKLAKLIIDELKARGRVERGWLGVQAQAVTPEIAQSFGLPRAEGLIVDHVSEAGPAAVAGLERGDIILSIDDHPFSNPSELPLIVSQIPIGTEVRLRIWRARKEMWIDVVVARLPQVEGARALDHQEARQQTCE